MRRITPPTWPVAPTTPTFIDPPRGHSRGPGPSSTGYASSSPGAPVDEGLVVGRAELEGVVDGPHGGVQIGVAEHHRDADLRRRDHLDVHARLGQRREERGRDTGV